MTEEKLNKRQIFALAVYAFAFAALVGWVYEVICTYLLYGELQNRGMLRLPLCPIYGFGAWGMQLLLRRVKNTPLFFVCSVLTASAFEYGAAVVLERILGYQLWSYAGWPISIQDRISLISSLIFGVLSLCFAKGVVPFLTKQLKKRSGTADFIAALFIFAVIAGEFLLFVFK